MVQIDEKYRGVRDKPISARLRRVLIKAATDAGIDRILIYSGGQPGSSGRSTGSPRHNGGNAGDLHLYIGDRIQRFTDKTAPKSITSFVTAAAKYGATGIGAGERYMGGTSLHIGFGLPRTVWGANGRRRNAPSWLVRAFEEAMTISSTPMQDFVVSARGGAALRRGPGHEYETTMNLSPDTVVAVLEIDGSNKDWARVDLVGDGYVDGHVHVSFLRPIRPEDPFFDIDDLQLEEDDESHSETDGEKESN